MTEPYESYEHVMPSALVFETDQSFNSRVKRNKARPSQYGNTSIFRHNGKNVVMGQEALTSGQTIRITGLAKYQQHVIDNLVFGALLKVAPEGHDNVFVSCAHSSNAVGLIETIAGLLGKRHEIERSDGQKISFNVRHFMPWDEPAGSILRFGQRERGNGVLDPGKRVGIVDIGGRVSSMYAAETLPGENIQIYWNEGDAFEGGIQIITEELEKQMRDLYPEFANQTTISPVTLDRALRDVRVIDNQYQHFTTHKGREVNVTQAVLNATAPTLDRINSIYTNKLRGGSDLDYIVVGGGGGGLLFVPLSAEVLTHEYVYKAEEDDCMHLANLRGGVIASNSYAIEHYKEIVKVGKDGAVKRPLMLIIDPGNTNTKFEAMWL